jgi:hypothetical protein
LKKSTRSRGSRACHQEISEFVLLTASDRSAHGFCACGFVAAATTFEVQAELPILFCDGGDLAQKFAAAFRVAFADARTGKLNSLFHRDSGFDPVERIWKPFAMQRAASFFSR